MKHKIRGEMLSRRKHHGKTECKTKDCAIREKLFSLPEFCKAKTTLFYVSVNGEVGTEEAISESLRLGKRILVPFARLKDKSLIISEINDLNELSPGAFGIPEPRNPKEFPLDKIDLVIIPGLAFDREGNRVGHGMGFYDKFLKNLRKDVPLVALAYDFQIAEKVPAHPHDVMVHKIVTEKEIIDCV